MCTADVLAGRKTVGNISGQILFAGQHATRTFLRRYTGYVEQFGERPVLHRLMRHLCGWEQYQLLFVWCVLVL